MDEEKPSALFRAFPQSQRRAIEKLLAAWRTYSPKFEKVEQHKIKADQDKIERQTSAVLRLIKASKLLELGFDPYQLCNVKPLEKYTRDFIYESFNSDDMPLLGRKLFSLILNEAELVKNGRFKNAVASIRRACKGDYLYCEKEIPMNEARPDIVISGERFLLAIEIKRRYGVETKKRGRMQTYRLKCGAQSYAEEKGINRAAVLALFLTPDGVTPADDEVIPISFIRLYERIDRAITRDRNVAMNTKRAMHSFMDLLTRG